MNLISNDEREALLSRERARRAEPGYAQRRAEEDREWERIRAEMAADAQARHDRLQALHANGAKCSRCHGEPDHLCDIACPKRNER